jgi:hypothetical protein
MKTAAASAFAGIALLASGCAGSSQADIDHPAPASKSPGAGGSLVLRTTTSGGIAGLGGPGSAPDFSLYADGRAVVRSGTRLTEYHLTPKALKRLVSAASDAGLATPRSTDARNIADAMYKNITFVTGGRARTSRIIQAGGKADPASDFLKRLDPSTWPRTDLTAGPQPYHAARVAVLALPAAGSGPSWPFKPLTGGTHVGTRTCTVLDGADAAKAERAATSTPQWTDHSRTFRVTVRPLLPDEPGCAALAH